MREIVLRGKAAGRRDLLDGERGKEKELLGVREPDKAKIGENG